jgi:small GTP-binding protein
MRDPEISGARRRGARLKTSSAMTDLDFADADFLVKLILVGDSGVGKTNLLTRFTRDEFASDSKATVGVEFATKTLRIDERVVRAQVWDTAGHERYRAITAAYYRGAVGALLVYDVTAPATFEALPRWLAELRANVDGEALIVVVGNKADLPERAVAREDGLRFSQRERLPFVEASARTAANVADLFALVVRHAVERAAARGTDADSMATALVRRRPLVIAPAPEALAARRCCPRGREPFRAVAAQGDAQRRGGL